MAELISIDDTIDTAYDIFLEMAPDNLEPADVILFTAQFDDRGAAELVDVGDDWDDQVVSTSIRNLCRSTHWSGEQRK